MEAMRIEGKARKNAPILRAVAGCDCVLASLAMKESGIRRRDCARDFGGRWFAATNEAMWRAGPLRFSRM